MPPSHPDTPGDRALHDYALTAQMLGMDALLCAPVEVMAAPPARTPAVSAAGDDKAERMAELRARYEREAPHAEFNTRFNKIVWGDGPLNARLMFIGEAPGRDEDEAGIPFVGRAGQLLNKMIDAMGLCRGDKPGGVYIANVLKTRPIDNATPTTAEARACAPYLHEQISIVSPRVIVTLGLPATHLMLDTTEAMGKLRGQWAAFEDRLTGRSIPVMPTYHPAYLLRSYTPENRKKVWADLQLAMKKLA